MSALTVAVTQKLLAHISTLSNESRALDNQMVGIAREVAAVGSSKAKMSELLSRVQENDKRMLVKIKEQEAERRRLEVRWLLPGDLVWMWLDVRAFER